MADARPALSCSYSSLRDMRAPLAAARVPYATCPWTAPTTDRMPGGGEGRGKAVKMSKSPNTQNLSPVYSKHASFHAKLDDNEPDVSVD